jgi:hypothetical protein
MTITMCLLAGVDIWTMIVVVPVTDDFWLLVAVTVIFPVDPGAVNTPLASIVPPVADQLTEEFMPPWTVAVHCDFPLGATDEGLQLTAIVGSAVTIGDLLLPPHPVHERGMMHRRTAKELKYLDNSLFIPHRKRGERTYFEIGSSRLSKGAEPSFCTIGMPSKESKLNDA